jgi:uncharacterized lipoprotein YddW (UPF0748 family)
MSRKNMTRWCAGLLLAIVGAAAVNAQDKFRGFWADAFHEGFKSTSQINNLISRAVQGNYNAVVIEVLAYQHDTGGGSGAYWNSSIIPKANDISGGIDPLAEVITRAHANGLEVHAWIVPFRVSYSWPPAGNSYMAARPHWLMVTSSDSGGGPAPVSERYVLDPGSPEVQDYITSIVVELVTNYAIDGINLDYIRYTDSAAGYPADASYEGSSLARFKDLTGYVGTPPPYGDSQWNDFRRQTISEVVRRLNAEIASIDTNPRQPVALSADLICFGDAPSNFESSDAYVLHQNWKYWFEQGYLDAGMPMNYKREGSSSQRQWYRNWINTAVSYAGDRHVYCGQANYLNTKAQSVTQLSYALNAGADGTMNYSYVGTADEDQNGSWESDWSWYPYVASNLFTAPVNPPALTWRDPALATEGVIWGQVVGGLGASVDGVEVDVNGRDPVYTDGNGYFVVTRLPAAPGGTVYSVVVRSDDCPVEVAPSVLVEPGQYTRVDFGICAPGGNAGDMDEDGDIDTADVNGVYFCLQGPDATYTEGSYCTRGDADEDLDLDTHDIAAIQRNFTGSF